MQGASVLKRRIASRAVSWTWMHPGIKCEENNCLFIHATAVACLASQTSNMCSACLCRLSVFHCVNGELKCLPSFVSIHDYTIAYTESNKAWQMEEQLFRPTMGCPYTNCLFEYFPHIAGTATDDLNTATLWFWDWVVKLELKQTSHSHLIVVSIH